MPRAILEPAGGRDRLELSLSSLTLEAPSAMRTKARRNRNLPTQPTGLLPAQFEGKAFRSRFSDYFG